MFEGDDGRFYSSEAEWEYAYDEGAKAEMRAILLAEMDDPSLDEYDDFIGPMQPYNGSDEIPY